VLEGIGTAAYMQIRLSEDAMLRKLLAATCLLAAVAAPSISFAAVKVRFVDPDRYTDAGGFGGGSRNATLAELRGYLQQLGGRYLPPGQTLDIMVLDIDLAGSYEPWRAGMSDVRILRDVTPPRIRLRYVLSERGRRLRSGEETLSDINYQMNPSARASGDRYTYEKALLSDWFRRNFAARTGGEMRPW